MFKNQFKKSRRHRLRLCRLLHCFCADAERSFSEMILIDADTDRAEGEALDISHGTPFAKPMKIYAGTYQDITDAAVIIITAGANQKPDESRLDLVNKNTRIIDRKSTRLNSSHL